MGVVSRGSCFRVKSLGSFLRIRCLGSCSWSESKVLFSGITVRMKGGQDHQLKSNAHLPKKICLICFNESPFKSNKKCFLFHLKISFCFQDSKIFVLTFRSFRKNGLIRKILLISKFMTSQPD